METEELRPRKRGGQTQPKWKGKMRGKIRSGRETE